MWSTLEDAIKKYAPQRDQIMARHYSLPWAPMIPARAGKYLEHIYPGGIRGVHVNTPSLGQYWPTHPTFKYDNGRAVFLKVSRTDIIMREYKNLMALKRWGVSVPTPLGVYTVPENLYEEDLQIDPRLIRGTVLVEEFLHSISLGHAIIERRILTSELVPMVLNALKWMHRFGVHGDLKHQHIRICVPSKAAVRMIYRPPRDDIVVNISRIAVIDMEGFKAGIPRNEMAEGHRADLEYLKRGLEDYLRTIDEEDPKKVHRVTKMNPEQRWEKFGFCWKALEDAYSTTQAAR